eukprot:1388260-Pleurochrysis_carterae.AAC.1
MDGADESANGAVKMGGGGGRWGAGRGGRDGAAARGVARGVGRGESRRGRCEIGSGCARLDLVWWTCAVLERLLPAKPGAAEAGLHRSLGTRM